VLGGKRDNAAIVCEIGDKGRKECVDDPSGKPELKICQLKKGGQKERDLVPGEGIPLNK